MKPLYIVLTFLISSAASEVILQESFDGALFPPTGWSIINIVRVGGSAWGTGSGTWIQGSNHNNDYAFCSSEASGYSAFDTFYLYESILRTPAMALNAGDTLKIEFDCYWTHHEFMYYNEVSLAQGKNYGTDFYYPYPPLNTVQSLTFTTSAVPATASDYYVRFASCSELFNYVTHTSGDFWIDNVTITRNPSGRTTTIQPSSLSKLKATYH